VTSLHRFKEPRAVPLAVAALSDPASQLVALQCLHDLGNPEQLKAVLEAATHNPSAEVLPLALRTLTHWGNQDTNRKPDLDRAAAVVQGTSGILARWNVLGPLPEKEAASLRERLTEPSKGPDAQPPWQTAFAAGPEARVSLGAGKASSGAARWLAFTDVFVPEPASVQFLASAGGSFRVWLNGRLLHQRNEARAFQPDADRFEAALDKGPNRVLIQLEPAKGRAEFHVRYRRKSATAAHEQLIQAALARAGNAERGRKLFFDAARTQCIKCHRMGDQGERIGPELTGVGGRFSRIYLIESILEPNRTTAPGYETVLVALKDGRVLVGTRVAETADTLTLGDNKGEKHTLEKSRIEERRTHPLSTMPEGLEKPLSAEEFTDLIAFLVSQKK
jgi:putative heme-binding domain-containing protein